MSALDTAKEIGRMAATATLGKDVIDLFEKKVALLTEQVAALEAENAELKKKVENFEHELASLKPKGELEKDTVRFLQLLFQQPLTISQIANALGISKGMAEYHRDVLDRAKMIGLPMIVTMGRENPYHLLAKGREYLVKNGHV
jgi:predicted RNase H-like nuclease (RuvC/YqgF family)